MVISEQWYSYKDDDVQKAQFLKDTLIYDNLCEKVDYIFSSLILFIMFLEEQAHKLHVFI